MPLSATIRQDITDNKFNMRLIFDWDKMTYAVQFNSMSLSVNRSEEKRFTSFEDAFRCFKYNCMWYGVPTPADVTEEEFLGVPEGFLFPKVKAPVFKREVR